MYCEQHGIVGDTLSTMLDHWLLVDHCLISIFIDDSPTWWKNIDNI